MLLAACGQIAGLSALKVPTEPESVPAFYKLPWLLTGNNDACDSPEFEQRRRHFITAIRVEGVAMDEGFRGFTRRTSQRCRVVGDLRQARHIAAGTVVLHHPVLLEPPGVVERVAHAIRKVAEQAVA